VDLTGESRGFSSSLIGDVAANRSPDSDFSTSVANGREGRRCWPSWQPLSLELTELGLDLPANADVARSKELLEAVFMPLSLPLEWGNLPMTFLLRAGRIGLSSRRPPSSLLKASLTLS